MKTDNSTSNTQHLAHAPLTFSTSDPSCMLTVTHLLCYVYVHESPYISQILVNRIFSGSHCESHAPGVKSLLDILLYNIIQLLIQQINI